MPVVDAWGEAYICDAILEKATADNVTWWAQATTTVPSKAQHGAAATVIPRAEVTLTRDGDLLKNGVAPFGDASASGEELVGIEVYNAETDGDRFLFGPLVQHVITVVDVPVTLPAGTLTFSPDSNS